MRDDAAALRRANEMVETVLRNDTKGCPDPVQGGCMGNYCIRCAARELRGIIRELGERIDQLKRVR